MPRGENGDEPAARRVVGPTPGRVHWIEPPGESARETLRIRRSRGKRRDTRGGTPRLRRGTTKAGGGSCRGAETEANRRQAVETWKSGAESEAALD